MAHEIMREGFKVNEEKKSTFHGPTNILKVVVEEVEFEDYEFFKAA